jgi:hypothetical protein
MTLRGHVSSQVSRLNALQEKHAALSSRIEEAQHSLSTTDFYLRQLKKQKLVLKEEIENLHGRRATG